jgi:hypothetical protein
LPCYNSGILWYEGGGGLKRGDTCLCQQPPMSN